MTKSTICGMTARAADGRRPIACVTQPSRSLPLPCQTYMYMETNLSLSNLQHANLVTIAALCRCCLSGSNRNKMNTSITVKRMYRLRVRAYGIMLPIAIFSQMFPGIPVIQCTLVSSWTLIICYQNLEVRDITNHQVIRSFLSYQAQFVSNPLVNTQLVHAVKQWICRKTGRYPILII